MQEKRKKIFLGNQYNKICRFCGKKEPETTFKNNKSHTFPEFTGNKTLFSNYECKECNSFFGRTIEKAASDFFLQERAMYGIAGKGGNKQFKTADGLLSHFNNMVNDTPCPITVLHSKDAEKYITEDSSKGLTISTPRRPHIPVAVYKCFVKMAISVMPENELFDFADTISWLLEREHRNFYDDGRKLWLKVIYIPNAKKTNSPSYRLHKLTCTQNNENYVLFYIIWGGMCCGIEVPASKNLNYFDISELTNIDELKGYSIKNLDLSSNIKTDE